MRSPTSLKSLHLATRFHIARYFSVSLLFHLVLAACIGGAVLFKVDREIEVFVSDSPGGLLEQEEEQVAPEEQTTEEFEEPENASPAMESTPATASSIATLLPSPSSFQISNVTPIQTFGNVLASRASMETPSGSSLPGSSGGGMRAGSFFGVSTAQSKEGLIGMLFDLKQTRDRKPTGMTPEEYGKEVVDFTESWNSGKLRKYFRAPSQLAASQLFTPHMPANTAPEAFGVAKDVEPSMWLGWYRARVSPPKSGTYHFVGAGDDVLFIRLNGKLVLDRCWYLRSDKFKPDQNYDYGFSAINDGFAKGPGMQLREGQYYDLDILIGEQPGGGFFAAVLIEEDGATYEKDGKGNPILPIFRVKDELPRESNLPSAPHAKSGPVWKCMAPKPLPGEGPENS